MAKQITDSGVTSESQGPLLGDPITGVLFRSVWFKIDGSGLDGV